MVLWLSQRKKQMRKTPAITATEALKGDHPRNLKKETCPLMFEVDCFVADPNFHRRHVFMQMVDVPVLSHLRAQVPGDARSHAARPEGAADVNVIAGLQVEPSPAAYLDSFV